ncbi:MAG TPA: S8 family serine peptidase [Actinophytocola sp.]|uniref:S8 family peptidase n=1 Tax=Actinophytocola sp. TaxID=1872138 RepID=UPI002DBF8D9B|nr:S8 family serine peptidase [Actinophytocola sp.]HEU5472923.1 S8 family serine peptidase [Actinophytocola sp.]
MKIRRAAGRLARMGGVGAAAVILSLASPGAAVGSGAASEPTFHAVASGIQDSYIVSLRAELSGSDVERLARDLSSEHGGRLRGVHTAVGRGFTIEMPERQARKLAAHPDVRSVVQDIEVSLSDVQLNAPAHLDRIDERAHRPLDGRYNAVNAFNGASDSTIYVLDTGITAEHTSFGGRARVGFDTNDDFAVGHPDYGRDCNGHGTHVASLAGGNTYGVARSADVVAVKATRACTGAASLSRLVSAVEWVTSNATPGRSVVNMSLGYLVNNAILPQIALLEEAVQRSMDAGIAYVVSAGNENQLACTQSPARIPGVLTVAAISDVTDDRASFSNFGSCVDLYAPGTNIRAARHDSSTGTVVKSGTSMAAPLATGVVAHYVSNSVSAQDAVFRVKFEATPNVVTGEPNVNAARLLHFGGFHEDQDDVPIPDLGTGGISSIDVTGQGDPGSAMGTSLRLSFDIQHASRGQLFVELFAPNGQRWILEQPSPDTGDDLIRINVPINASAVAPNGRWQLRGFDTVVGTVGKIRSWSLQF